LINNDKDILTCWYGFFILLNYIMVGDSDPLNKWLEIHPRLLRRVKI